MKLTSLLVALAAMVVFSQAAQARGHHYHYVAHHEASRQVYVPHHFAQAQYRRSAWRRPAFAGRYHFAQARYGRSAWHRSAYAARSGFGRSNWGSDAYAARANFRQPAFRQQTWGNAYPQTAQRAYHGGLGPRPAAWCGWEMRQLVGADPGPAYNLARNWAHWGHAGPVGVGAIVVWPHHVGRIVGQQNGQWVVQSGNDGNRLRTRPQSVSGAIAFRWG